MNTFSLAIDVGNTRIKCGVMSSTNGTLPDCVDVIAAPIETGLDWTTVLASVRRHGRQIDRSIVSGSNPRLLSTLLQSWPESLGQPRRIDSSRELPIEIDVDEPDAVGLDRVLNAIAANTVRESTQPAIVIDSGTATTIDLISRDGVFRGGTILPGIELSARALHHYTDLLPLIEMSELDLTKLKPPGRNTRDAIQNGILYGHIGAIREIVRELMSESSEIATTLLTGGAGSLLSHHLSEARFIPFLALRGLALSAAG
jgi:type III pantothenate kinase